MATMQDEIQTAQVRWVVGTPYGKSSNSRVIEFFEVIRHARRHLTIRATRTIDLLSLDFELWGFDYDEDRNWIRGGGKSGRVVVSFPPQHIAETVRQKYNDPEDSQSLQDDVAVCETAEQWGYSDLRPAGKSRIEFEIDDPVDYGGQLSLETLLNWSVLRMKVDPRASSTIGADALSQLQALFPDKSIKELETIDTPELKERLFQSATTIALDSTELELVKDLTFSPSENATWSPSQQPSRDQNVVHNERAELWSVHLEGEGRTSLRAIYSHWLARHLAGLADLPTNQDLNGRIDPLLALTFANHWDIVAQTSLYGLPALKKIQEEKDQLDPLVSMKTASDALDAPPPTVVPTPAELDSLDYIEHHKTFYENLAGHRDVGLSLASPFSKAQVDLTALGAILDLEWRGDPSNILLRNLDQGGQDIDGKQYASFALETLIYRTWLGRDARIEAVEKGYLLPLGVRASLLTITERKVYGRKEGQTGELQPTSFEVQRQIIVIPEREKRFPGPYQFDGGRRFPAKRLNMKTRATPDLFRNADIIPGVAERTAFWPQVAVKKDAKDGTFVGQDFDFEWQTEDALVRSNLLFVSHRHIGDRDTMKVIKEAYNASEERLRRADFGGARQRYAKPGRPGDTSFDTNYWLMEAEGRIGTRQTPDSKETEVFDLDGRLAGADQPPIYPTISYANINVQTVDQTLGQAQGGVKVRPYGRYKRDGFVPENGAARRSDERQPETNPREIFLEVYEGEVALDSGKRSGRTGGVASPRANVAAFSRKDGIIGGQKLVRVADGAAFNFSKAEGGEFDPKQFFDGAKLLGIIDLGKLGDLAIDKSVFPHLQQVVEYGAGKGQEYVRRAATELLRFIYIDRNGLTKQLRNAIAATNARLKATEELSNYSFDDIVSADLNDAIKAIIDGSPPPLRERLEALEANPGIGEIAAVSELVDDIIEWVGDFLEDPTPPLIKDGLQRAADCVRWIEDASDPSNLRKRLADYLRVTLFDVLRDYWTPELARVLFGDFAFDANGNQRSLKQVLGQPSLAMAAIQENILSGAFDGLVEVAWPYLVTAADFVAQTDRYVKQLQARAEAALRNALIEIGEELDDFDGNLLDDLRQPEKREELIVVLKGRLEAAIQELLAGLSVKAFENGFDLRNLAKPIEKLEENSAQAIEAELLARASLIKAGDEEDRERLAKKIAKSLAEALVRRYLIAPLTDLFDKVQKAGEEKARQFLLAVEQLTQALIDSHLTGEIFVEISKLNDHAEIINQVRIAALALLEKGQADVNRLTTLAIELRGHGEELQSKSSWHAKQLGDEIVAVSERLTEALNRLTIVLDDAKKSAGAGLDLIDPLAEAVKLRTRMLDDLRELLAVSIGAVPDTAALEGQTAPTLLETLKALAKALTPAFENDWDWQEIRDVVDRLKAKSDIIKKHAEAVEAKLGEVAAAYKEMKAKFVLVSDYGELKDFLEEEVATLLGHVDDQLAGKLLQLTAFPEQVGKKLEAEMASAAMALWKRANANGPLAIFRHFGDEAARAQNLIAGLDEDLRDAINFILGGRPTGQPLAPYPLQNLSEALGDLATLANEIADLDKAPNLVALQAELSRIFGANGGAVKQVFEKFENAFDKIEVVNAGQVLTQAVSTLLDALEAELRALVRRFVPTRLTTTYSWESNIGQFPKDNKSAVYIPCRLSSDCKDPRPLGLPQDEEWPPKDVRLSSTFSFDFASREKLTAEVRGELHKFQLKILGEQWHMATITFTKCTFVSVNGAKPEFDVKIGEVVLGKMLKFLEPLQKWLSPDGTGFYLTLNQSPPGVTAGYIYNAGIIQLGTLQFINVNFGVDATLPFNGDEAEFGFALGSAKLPFMVANPPYGGGGWIRLTANAQGPTGMELSIFFGGVSAIRFGPLKGQGRIVAGLFVKTNSNKSRLLQAYFEAVGSGSIACFSISVSLVVLLTQRNGGKMYGKATFTFKFKLGFVKYSYRVQASYTISNGKSTRTLEALDLEALAGPMPTITVHMPRKTERWNEYRKLVDTSLI